MPTLLTTKTSAKKLTTKGSALLADTPKRTAKKTIQSHVSAKKPSFYQTIEQYIVPANNRPTSYTSMEEL